MIFCLRTQTHFSETKTDLDNPDNNKQQAIMLLCYFGCDFIYTHKDKLAGD